jgi:penicillin-binding protein 2
MRPITYQLHTSLFGILGGIFCVLTIILGRLFYMQINLVDHFTHRSEKNFTRITVQEPPRGNIVDATGTLLATNRPVTNLMWQGGGNRVLTSEQLDLIVHLESICGIPFTSDQERMYQLRMAELRYQQISLATDLTFEQLSQIQEQLSNCRNLLITHDFQRYYPNGASASHIVGYFSPESTGQMGIEKVLDDILKGKQGTILRTINSVGRPVASNIIQECRAGATIQTTIDINLQRICELIFPEYYTGTVILMDPHSGAIKALVSRPDFDPNMFLRPISSQVWQNLQQTRPFLNRACSASYPPGSLFKLITATAAIENHIIDPEASFYCPGYSTFADRQYRCHNKHGHGTLSVIQAVAHSCNVLFFEIGKRIDIDVIARYAHHFGLGEKTGFVFPEKSGIVPCKTWKRKMYKEPWWPGETLSVSIGQSFLMVTPLQIARMMGAICVGYLTKPRIILSEAIEKEPLPIQDTTRAFLQRSMKLVVTTGSGRSANTTKNMTLHAKTSTAQMSALEKRAIGTEYLEHGWFAGFFSYKTHDPLVMVILVEHAGSSQLAVAIAKNLLVEYKHLLDEQEMAATIA